MNLPEKRESVVCNLEAICNQHYLLPRRGEPPLARGSGEI